MERLVEAYRVETLILARKIHQPIYRNVWI